MRYAWILALAAVGMAGCTTAESEKSGDAGMTAAKPVAPATAQAAAPAVAAAPVGPALVDSVMPGDETAERNHAQKGENDETGDWNDRTYRHSAGGWFSWDLKVTPNQANDLVLTYWGGDNRTFDILINGQKLLTEQIQNDHPDEFFDKVHTLPGTLIGSKQKVTVRFQSPENGYAGGVFGVRIMRPGAVATKPAAKTP